MADLIRIDGLRQFNRSLKNLDADLPKSVRLAANAAAQIVVDEAVPKVPLGPAKGGHARDSIKAKSTRTAARISAGGKKFPYYAWLDFGGTAGPGKGSRRPFLKEGRFIWAAYALRRDDVQDALVTSLSEIAAQAGLEPES